MSSKAAACVYPALARAEDQRRQAEMRARLDTKTQPAWGKSNDPMWAEPRPAPAVDYSKVPGLRRVSK